MISLIFRVPLLKYFLLVFLGTTYLCANSFELNDKEKEWIKQNPVVSFSGDPDWLPFEAINSDGAYIGIVSDYLKYITKHTELNFILHPSKNWNETLSFSKSKKVDVISGDKADVILNQNYTPIAPYYIDPIVVLMSHDYHYSGDITSLKGKRIVIIDGYGYTAELYKSYPDLTFISMSTATEGLNALQEKKVDVILLSSSIAKYNLRRMGLEHIDIVGKTSVAMELTLFVKKTKPLLKTILDETVKNMGVQIKDEISDKWIHGSHYDNKLKILLLLSLLALIGLSLFFYMKYKKLKERRDYFKYVVDSSQEALWHYEVKEDEMNFSPALTKMLGCTLGESTHSIKEWIDRAHPKEKKDLYFMMIDRRENISDTHTIEHRILCEDNKYKWLKVRIKSHHDADGTLKRMDGFCTDITDDKRRLEDHMANSKMLEDALEIGHLGSWTWDIKTSEISWGDEVYRIFGEEPQAFKATYEGFTSYIPAEYLDGLQEAIDTAIKSHTAYEYDHEILRRDGTRRLVREAGYARYDDAGEAVSMFGTVLDINSLGEVKNAIKENKELNELLAKFDKNVIASNTDLEGIITYASEAFCIMSGFTRDELIGVSQNIVRHEDTPAKVFKAMWKELRADKTWSGELKNRRKDGSYYWVYNTISPIINSQGVKTGYSAIRHDITHAKEAQELQKNLEKKSKELSTLNLELEQRIKDAVKESKLKDNLISQQSKLASMGEMIGNIAHQWRQPLNALGLLIQKQELFFNKGMLTPEKMKESVDKSNLLVQKMSTTIDDFRDFYKPNKEKVNFSIKEAIDETLSLIDAALYNKNIHLSVSMEDDATVYGYKNEFSQVILNLVNNAKDAFSFDQLECEIKINSFMKNDQICIELSDNAGGIKSDVIEHVFEPYFTTKEEGKGTGIGLYMAKMIIEENMSGSLLVTNNDVGASFSIFLDLSTQS